MAYAYTVTGSEDGTVNRYADLIREGVGNCNNQAQIVGVYGNRTRAENAAKKYIENSYRAVDRASEDYNINIDKCEWITLMEGQSKDKIYGYYSMGAQSTVEKFYLG